MPFYWASCKHCKKTFRYMSTISERNSSVECECGSQANRDIEVELAPKSATKWVTDNERWSLSMGVPAGQVEAFRKRFPNSTYDNNGRLLIKNRKDKLRQIKERDMVELDNRR